MRKILSLFAAILFAGSMMAEVGSLYYTFLPYKPAKDGVSDYTKTGTMTIDEMDWTVPGNWFATGGLRLGGKSLDGVDRTIIGQDPMGSAIAKIRIAHAGVTSDKIVLNSITVTTASDADFTQNVTTKTVTGFTVAKNTKDTIDVVPTTEPWAINSYYKIAFNLTNSQASNYAFVVESILFYAYVAGGGDDPEPESTVKTIYCKCAQSWWKADGAAVAAHYWKDGGEGTTWPGVRMTAVDGETDLWKIDVDLAKYEKIIFVRVNASGDIADWGAKSGDQTIPTDDKDLFTITSTSAVWGDPGVEGSWSKYEAGSTPEPPTPAEKDSIYFVNVPGWDNLRVHLWGGTAAGTTWPGVEMTKLGEDDKINGYDVYKYVALEGAYTQCIFSNNGENKTVDLNWTSGKYYYDGAWYAKADIPEPIPAAVPLEGNIWKVTDKTPVRAGSHYIDEALLKVDGVYATTLKPNTRTIAGEEFTYAIQVRTDGYPTQDVLAGKEKSGSTSLIITAKEDVDITLYYNRQAIDATGTENDNKDLIVFDQAAIDTKVTGVFTVVEVLSDNNYLNATKKLALKKGHVYTVTASGTTLQLHGIKLEEHIPAMQIAGAWDVKDEAWVVNNMTLAGDAKTATYEVELSKGDYEFKVLKDGAWLTKANDGAYGLHREWPGVAGVTDDAANNLKVTADAAGKYIFTWTFANDSIGITFPAPEPTKYFLKNNWDGAETWTWKEMTNDDGSYILAEVVFGGTGVNINTVESDEGTSWIDAKDIEAFDLSYEPATLGALDTVVFFFDPEAVNTYTGENGLSALILGKYVAPVPEPVLEDGFYLIGKIGGVDGWNVADLKAEQKFAPNLENPVEFMLNVTLAEGDEIKVVNVLSDVITAWFPGDGSSNFVVTAAYAGEKTVYFRPDQQGGEGWYCGCIYIAPNQATGISNNAVEGKAVKMIMDDQLLIIRNGKTYNVQGQQLK